MQSIKIKPGPAYNSSDEEWLAKRIASIVDGSDIVEQKNTGFKWNLGRANDWWLDIDPTSNEIIIAYRYGGGANEENMEKLRSIIIWLLG